MDILLKISVMLVCGALNAFGGYSWHNARRYLMPVLLSLETSYISWKNKPKTWWTGFLVLPVIGTLVLGYKNFGKGNFSRAMWLFLQAVVIGLLITVTGHVALFIYIPYAVGAGILGGFYKNWNQILGDSVAGVYLGLIVFFVR